VYTLLWGIPSIITFLFGLNAEKINYVSSFSGLDQIFQKVLKDLTLYTSEKGIYGLKFRLVNIHGKTAKII